MSYSEKNRNRKVFQLTVFLSRNHVFCEKVEFNSGTFVWKCRWNFWRTQFRCILFFQYFFRYEKFSGSCITPKPPLYEEAIALYKISFPHHEQREQASQCEILKNTDYHFEVICDEGCLIGKILYWCIEKLCYIEHFLYFTLYAKSTLRTEDPRSIAGRTLWN